MSIGAKGIQHIGISVPDLDKAREFYLDLLGAVEVGPPLEWRDNPFIDRVVGLDGSAARQSPIWWLNVARRYVAADDFGNRA